MTEPAHNPFFGTPFWFGLLGTAVVSLALFSLEPPGSAATVLAGLVLVSACWHFAWWRSQASIRRPEQTRGVAGSVGGASVMGTVHRLLNETVSQLSVQHAAVRDDLGRVQTLLAQAITELAESFGEIHAEADRMRELVVAMENGQRGTAITGMDASAATVGDLLGRAAIALQFHDLVSQLMGHTLRRVGALDAVVDKLGELNGVLEGVASAQDVSAALRAIEDRSERLARGLRELGEQTKRNPVGQRALASGDIELF